MLNGHIANFFAIFLATGVFVPVFEILEELQTPSVPRVRFRVRNASVPGKTLFFWGNFRTIFADKKWCGRIECVRSQSVRY